MFVGREAAIAEVVRLLRRGALVTLSGPAGAGKTRLALEVAARQRERFRDGAWFVDLAPLARPELIADAIAAATGLTQSGRSPSAAALVDWLAGRELLIVLDNCEHLIAGCAETVEQVLRGCPAVQVLATSREPLALTGELVWRVPSLTLPDATRSLSPAELLGYESVRLFVERARAVQPRFALTEANAGDVVGICRRLDGMPLAIELAAARAGSLPPAEIARRLVASFGLLRQPAANGSRRGSRRWRRRWTGATASWRRPRRGCWGASVCSRGASALTPPSRSAATAAFAARRSWTCWRIWSTSRWSWRARMPASRAIGCWR